MKNFFHILFACFLGVAAVAAQDAAPKSTSSTPTAASESKRGPVFRASKVQISAAQTILRSKGLYTAEPTGKLDPATRASIKSFQKDNGLNDTGTLNRATLEKLGVELTEKQKAIPIPESSYAKAKSSGSENEKPRGPVFRATKDQVIDAQRLLKSSGMYAGEESGKLDDPTRAGLKKYQEANGLKATGTLNQVTLEKMGIALTEKQRSVGTRD